MTIQTVPSASSDILHLRFTDTITALDIERALTACLEAAEQRPVGLLVDFAADALAPDVLGWLFHSADYRALADHPNVRAWACVAYSVMAWLAVQAFALPLGVEVFSSADEARAYLLEQLSDGWSAPVIGQP